MSLHWRDHLRTTRRPINGLLRTRLVASLVTPRSIDDYLELIDATWSVQAVRARISAIQWQTRSAGSLLLQPNELWRGFRAGQYVAVSIRHAGVRYTRCFSISSAPEDGLPLRVTIQAVPGGRVSEWLLLQAQVGDVVELSQAQGAFVLPEAMTRRPLFISAGSGITPVLSMARHLRHRGHRGALRWLHYSRRESLFEDELSRLSAQLPGLELFHQRTRGGRAGSARPHFSAEQLERCVPEWRECDVFACGPASLLASLQAHWTQHGLSQHLHVERFVPGRFSVAESGDHPSQAGRLVFARSGIERAGRTGSTLLEQAEAAGLAPPSGCRMGVCHTCVCRKVSGVVHNELTGQISDEPDQTIQLCINTPRSDVVLDL